LEAKKPRKLHALLNGTCNKITASSSSQATALWQTGRQSGDWTHAPKHLFLRPYVIWHTYGTKSYGRPVTFLEQLLEI